MLVGELIDLLQPFRGRGERVVVAEKVGEGLGYWEISTAEWNDKFKVVLVVLKLDDEE